MNLPSLFMRVASVVSIVLVLSGCAGYIHGSAEYEEVPFEPTSRAEVIRRFGQPLRSSAEGEYEVLHYKLTGSGLSSDRTSPKGVVSSTMSSAMLVVVPVWSTTKYAENAKVYLKGDAVVKAMNLVDKSRGLICGVLVGHTVEPGCLTH